MNKETLVQRLEDDLIKSEETESSANVGDQHTYALRNNIPLTRENFEKFKEIVRKFKEAGGKL